MKPRILLCSILDSTYGLLLPCSFFYFLHFIPDSPPQPELPCYFYYFNHSCHPTPFPWLFDPDRPIPFSASSGSNSNSHCCSIPPIPILLRLQRRQWQGPHQPRKINKYLSRRKTWLWTWLGMSPIYLINSPKQGVPSPLFYPGVLLSSLSGN